MDNLKKKIEFDPGFAPIVIESLGQVGYIYYMFSSIRERKLKKINFASVSAKLEKHLKANVTFYIGCLLWASYISQFENYEISGNKLLGEDCKEEDYTNELDFLIDFIENQYPRDTKYYQNRIYNPDERYIPILKTYREFLVINKGFCACSNTSDILLPENLKKQNKEQLDKIKNIIFKAIEDKDLNTLIDCYEILF